MIRFLLFLALAGFACGLQAPLLYKYKYFGSISSGIPELSSQASAWAMKANIEVYIQKDDGVAVFDIDDFKMAEYNGELGCDSRGDIPDELFHPADDDKINQAVESTFKVHLFNFELDFAIEDDSEEYPWLTNMRKGIASIFKNEVLRGNIDSQVEETIASHFHDGNAVIVFSVKEETIFGLCEVDYTVTPFPEYLSGTRNHELERPIEEDIQRDQPESSPYTTKKGPKKSSKKKSSKRGRKTTKTKTGKYQKPNVPPLEDDLWHVVRSVNFDHCDEVVSIQGTPIGINKPVSGGQYEWARGRSSTAEYIFRGSPGKARVEKAIVEGATTFAPFGIKTELLQARTNQTLTLVSVKSLGKVPSLPAKCQQSKTWMYQVFSFAPTPVVSKPHPWVIYTGKGAKSFRNYQLVGLPAFTSDELATMKSNISNYITEAALRLSDIDQEEEPTDPSHPGVQELLLKAAELFRESSKEDVLQIFDQFFEKDLHQHDILAKKLVVDAAASSGSYFAYAAILDYIKQGKIPELQIMTIFMSLTNNAECPSNFPDLLDYVLTLNIKEKPFLTATVLVNFAELLHEFCINPHARDVSYAGQLFGDNSCEKDLIKSRFAPHLAEMITGHYTTWEKDVALEAVRALGSSFSFPILSPVIEGRYECSNRIRSLAIYALASWKLSRNEHLRKPIMDLLTEVYADVGEDSEVREAALITIVSWRPETNFWHTLARTSWREPSKQFSTFVTSLIYSFAHFEHPFYIKQNQAALHALRFAKPVAPSEKYSLVHMMTKRLIERHVTKFETLQIHKNDHGFNEREFYYFLMTNLGGFEYINLELFTITDGFFQGYKSLLAKKEEEGGAVGIAARIAQDFYDRIQDTIKAQTISRDAPSGGIFLKVFDHMSLYFPLNKETLSTSQFADPTKLASLIVQLGLGYDLVLGKYVRPINVYSFYPTELGLPLTTFTSIAILYSEVTYLSLGLGGKSISMDSLKKIEVSGESLAKFSTLGSSGLIALLPWNSRQVGVGITSQRDVTLPINGLVRNDQRDYAGGHHNILHLEFQSLYKKKFTLVKATNVPYTAIFNIIARDNRKDISFKPILTTLPKPKTVPLGSLFTGISTELKWNSGISLSTVSWKVHEFLRNHEKVTSAPWLIYLLASPTLHFWDLEFLVDPALSKTKNVSIDIIWGTYEKPTEETGQISQKTGGDEFSQYGQDTYSQYDQETFDVEQGFQEIGAGPEVETLNNINYGDTLQQRSEKLQSHFGGTAYSKSVKINFDGDEHRSYELLLSFSKSARSQSRKLKKSQISLIRSPIPHVDNKPASLCLDMQKSLPVFSKLDTVEDLLAANLDKDVKAELTIDCKGTPILEAKGTYKMSNAGLEKLKQTVPESCNFDPYNPLYTVHSEAVYDDIKFSIGWEKLCDSSKHPVAANLLSLICNLNPERKSELELHRCPVREIWHLKSDNKHSFDLPSNNAFNFAFAIGKKHTVDFYPDHYSTFNLESDKCVIGDHHVRTFDGFTYDFEPTSCWTVAAKDCSVEQGRMLLVRSAKGELSTPDAKYIDTRKGLVIEYNSNTVRVNGKLVDPIGEEEIIKDDEGKFLVAIHKKHDWYMAKFSRNFYFVAKNGKIKVHLPDTMRGSMCGLCGNFDGEPETELVGPHECLYSDPKLFAASWSAGSDTCDLYTLLTLREKAEKYQQSCRKIDNIYGICQNFNDRCFKAGFKVIKKGNTESCISVNTIPYCTPYCSISEQNIQSIEFNCWPNEHAPTIISEALASGEEYTLRPVKEDAYYEHVHQDVLVASICISFPIPDDSSGIPDGGGGLLVPSRNKLGPFGSDLGDGRYNSYLKK